MIAHLLALWLALFVPQAASTSTPPATDTSSTLPASTGSTTPAKAPCHNPDAKGKYRIGCGVTSPVIIQQVEPKYPEEARAKKLPISGIVISLTVDVDGNPVNIQVKNSKVDKVDKDARSAQQQLEDDLVDAVRQYKFKPATFEGKPVPVDLNVEINIDVF
jgi:TonB family protein